MFPSLLLFSLLYHSKINMFVFWTLVGKRKNKSPLVLGIGLCYCIMVSHFFFLMFSRLHNELKKTN